MATGESHVKNCFYLCTFVPELFHCKLEHVLQNCIRMTPPVCALILSLNHIHYVCPLLSFSSVVFLEILSYPQNVNKLSVDGDMCAWMSLLPQGILERLNAGEVVIGDGGFVFALEKRGYVKAGPWTPEATVTHPEAGKTDSTHICCIQNHMRPRRKLHKLKSTKFNL